METEMVLSGRQRAILSFLAGQEHPVRSAVILERLSATTVPAGESRWHRFWRELRADSGRSGIMLDLSRLQGRGLIGAEWTLAYYTDSKERPARQFWLKPEGRSALEMEQNDG